jgi:hypothetical protein
LIFGTVLVFGASKLSKGRVLGRDEDDLKPSEDGNPRFQVNPVEQVMGPAALSRSPKMVGGEIGRSDDSDVSDREVDELVEDSTEEVAEGKDEKNHDSTAIGEAERLVRRFIDGAAFRLFRGSSAPAFGLASLVVILFVLGVLADVLGVLSAISGSTPRAEVEESRDVGGVETYSEYIGVDPSEFARRLVLDPTYVRTLESKILKGGEARLLGQADVDVFRGVAYGGSLVREDVFEGGVNIVVPFFPSPCIEGQIHRATIVQYILSNYISVNVNLYIYIVWDDRLNIGYYEEFLKRSGILSLDGTVLVRPDRPAEFASKLKVAYLKREVGDSILYDHSMVTYVFWNDFQNQEFAGSYEEPAETALKLLLKIRRYRPLMLDRRLLKVRGAHRRGTWDAGSIVQFTKVENARELPSFQQALKAGRGRIEALGTLNPTDAPCR